MMNVSTGAGAAYTYIVNLSGVSTFLVWGAISFIHLRFRSAWAKQGRHENQLPFKSAFYPWNAYFGLAANGFLALVQGWQTLSPFKAGNFVDAYILLPIFAVIYFVYKVGFKTKHQQLLEIDLDTNRRKDVDTHDHEKEYNGEDPTYTAKRPLWRRIAENF